MSSFQELKMSGSCLGCLIFSKHINLFGGAWILRLNELTEYMPPPGHNWGFYGCEVPEVNVLVNCPRSTEYFSYCNPDCTICVHRFNEPETIKYPGETMVTMGNLGFRAVQESVQALSQLINADERKSVHCIGCEAFNEKITLTGSSYHDLDHQRLRDFMPPTNQKGKEWILCSHGVNLPFKGEFKEIQYFSHSNPNCKDCVARLTSAKSSLEKHLSHILRRQSRELQH